MGIRESLIVTYLDGKNLNPISNGKGEIKFTIGSEILTVNLGEYSVNVVNQEGVALIINKADEEYELIKFFDKALVLLKFLVSCRNEVKFKKVVNAKTGDILGVRAYTMVDMFDFDYSSVQPEALALIPDIVQVTEDKNIFISEEEKIRGYKAKNNHPYKLKVCEKDGEVKIKLSCMLS